jgi:TorA maturation chaperone TorD
MVATQRVDHASAVDLARECLYRFLASALDDPRGGRWGLLADAPSRGLAADAADLLREEWLSSPFALGFGELPAEALDLRPLLAGCARPRGDLAAEYERVFGLVPCRECPPLETEYLTTTEPFFRAQQLADVAGFYRAFGLEPSRDHRERPDHLVLELEFVAILLAKQRLAQGDDQSAVCGEAATAFLRDHLIWWAPSFAGGLRRKACGTFYPAAANALAALLTFERGRIGLEPPRLPIRATPIEPPEEQAGCASCTP